MVDNESNLNKRLKSFFEVANGFIRCQAFVVLTHLTTATDKKRRSKNKSQCVSRIHPHKKTILEEVSTLGNEYPVEEAASELRRTNCYHGWESDLRYFLYRYEEYLSRKQGSAISEEIWQQIWRVSASHTIEHIHPQSARAQQEHIHRLGNLTLLPPKANAKAGKKTFQQKRALYKENQQLKLMDEIIDKRRWTKAEIEERENRLLDWAIDEWA